MSYQEKRSLVSLVSNGLVSLVYLLLVFQRAQVAGGGLNPDPRFWAIAILLLIPIYIVFQILFRILLIVANVVATGADEDDLVDEYDRLVELKSTRAFSVAFSAGFFLALALVALGRPLHEMFITLLLTVVGAGLVMFGAEFYAYRRGV